MKLSGFDFEPTSRQDKELRGRSFDAGQTYLLENMELNQT